MPDNELIPVERIQSQFATGSQTHRDPRFLPYAFTEHGAIRTGHMAASDDLMP